MIVWADEAVRVGAALAAGVLIGIERGWTQRAGRDGTRVAGVRTFTLLGLAGGLAGLLGAKGQPLAAGSLAAGATALLVAGYFNRLKERPDATTPTRNKVLIHDGTNRSNSG